MSGVYKSASQAEGNVLFLLRTYNDIDHIAPVIWKVAKMGREPFFLFVADDHHDDYRIKFLVEVGAKAMFCPPICWYHRCVRRWLPHRWVRRSADRLIAYTFGTGFLVRHKITMLASEWSGAFGREMAEYFLRPAQTLRLRCVSLPHGYYIWTNNRINSREVSLWQEKGERPDFTDRNAFSTYVVQNDEARCFKSERGVLPDKLKVLGSARFCPEWFEINLRLISDKCPELPKFNGIRLLFFVPDWSYNIDQKECEHLLEKLANIDRVMLVIKANTRGTGALSNQERKRLSRKKNVQFSGLSEHSPCLIKQSDAVINFASSIGIDALLQGKPVCNPQYLTRNGTIFDESGVVFDANGEEEVLSFIESVRSGHHGQIPTERWSTFHKRYVLGDIDNEDVLQDYFGLLFSDPALSGTSSPVTQF